MDNLASIGGRYKVKTNGPRGPPGPGKHPRACLYHRVWYPNAGKTTILVEERGRGRRLENASLPSKPKRYPTCIIQNAQKIVPLPSTIANLLVLDQTAFWPSPNVRSWGKRRTPIYIHGAWIPLGRRRSLGPSNAFWRQIATGVGCPFDMRCLCHKIAPRTRERRRGVLQFFSYGRIFSERKEDRKSKLTGSAERIGRCPKEVGGGKTLTKALNDDGKVKRAGAAVRSMPGNGNTQHETIVQALGTAVPLTTCVHFSSPVSPSRHHIFSCTPLTTTQTTNENGSVVPGYLISGWADGAGSGKRTDHCLNPTPHLTAHTAPPLHTADPLWSAMSSDALLIITPMPTSPCNCLEDPLSSGSTWSRRARVDQHPTSQTNTASELDTGVQQRHTSELMDAALKRNTDMGENRVFGYAVHYPGSAGECSLSTLMAADTANGALGQIEERYNTFILEVHPPLAGAQVQPVVWGSLQTWELEMLREDSVWDTAIGGLVEVFQHGLGGSGNGRGTASAYTLIMSPSLRLLPSFLTWPVQLEKARSAARATDVSSMKIHIHHWRKFDPPINPMQRHTMGFYNNSSGQLLCPAGRDWADSSVQHGLIDGTIEVGPGEFPLFLWKDETFKPTETFTGFLRGDILVKPRGSQNFNNTTGSVKIFKV
ncbi:hypothetical protein BD779DRAFT_1472131 [Infundibulicybe gibba]|nr:hypothetical protein BD779DRAFT_1472131 [Infundibulicybe gibba]